LSLNYQNQTRAFHPTEAVGAPPSPDVVADGSPSLGTAASGSPSRGNRLRSLHWRLARQPATVAPLPPPAWRLVVLLPVCALPRRARSSAPLPDDRIHELHGGHALPRRHPRAVMHLGSGSGTWVRNGVEASGRGRTAATSLFYFFNKKFIAAGYVRPQLQPFCL